MSGTPATPATGTITSRIELDNSVVSGGSGYTLSYTHNGNITVRMRATYQSGTTAYMPIVDTRTVTTTGADFGNTQENDTEYNSYGVDGSTVTEITASYDEQDNVNKFEISVDDPDNTMDSRRGAAWFRYITQTEQGIREFDPEAVQYNPDIRNILISPAIRIYNADTSNPLTITEGLWQNSDSSTLYDTTGGSIFWLVDDRVYQGPETGVSGLTASESTKLDNTLKSNAAVDGSIDVADTLKIALAALAGKSSDMESNAPKFRNQADDADVISATTDANGNRTAVTLNP